MFHAMQSVVSRRTAMGAVLAVLIAGSAAAQDRKLDVQVMSIRATNANKDVSPELKNLADELRKQTSLTGFSLEKRCEEKAGKADPAECDVGRGYSVKVTPVDSKDGRVTLQVKISRKAKGKADGEKKGDKKSDKGDEKDGDAKDKTVVDTKVTLDAGKSQLWAFAHPGGGGDKFIIAVSAK